jgi:hypothetical protein
MQAPAQRGVACASLPSREAKGSGPTHGSTSAPSAPELRTAPAQPPPPSTLGRAGDTSSRSVAEITQQFSQSEMSGGLRRQLSANQQTLQ